MILEGLYKTGSRFPFAGPLAETEEVAGNDFGLGVALPPDLSHVRSAVLTSMYGGDDEG